MKSFSAPVNLLKLASLALLAGLTANAIAHGDGGATTQAEATKASYNAASQGTRNLVLGPVTIKMLVEASNLGRDDIEVGELHLPAGFGEGTAHAHGSLEIFYVVEGILGHEVNGKPHTLNPGDVGFVNAGDQVRHSVLSEDPVKAVVIWLPGGEAAALIEHAGFMPEAIE